MLRFKSPDEGTELFCGLRAVGVLGIALRAHALSMSTFGPMQMLQMLYRYFEPVR